MQQPVVTILVGIPSATTTVVMAGLVPAIHDLPWTSLKFVDARLKAGHDEGICGVHHSSV
jgi:hypothetical protein